MALAHGVRQGLAFRYWEASLVWKGTKDHPRITNFEELIDELAILRTQPWQVGRLAELMMRDVVEDVRRRPLYPGNIYAWNQASVPILVPEISRPETMVS